MTLHRTELVEYVKRKAAVAVVLPMLVAALAVAACVAGCRTGRPRLAGASAAGVAVLAVVLLAVPLPTWLFYDDLNRHCGAYELVCRSTWVTVYRVAPGRLLKVFSTPGVSHQDYGHVSLPTPFRQCLPGGCTVPCMVAHDVSTHVIMVTQRRLWDLQRAGDPVMAFFPRMYACNVDRMYTVVEEVPLPLRGNCPRDLHAQLAELNRHLVRLGLVLDDMHNENFMVDARGRIRAIDGELFTTDEIALQQRVLTIDTSQTRPAQPYASASNVLFWQDGRLSGEQVAVPHTLPPKRHNHA